MVKTNLLSPGQSRDFVVSTPLNEKEVWVSDDVRGTCLVDADYSGDDPTDPNKPLFPVYHVKAGFGTKKYHGGFHQDIKKFAPEKVRVMPCFFPNGKEANVIQIDGNYDGRGVGVCTLSFQPAIQWQRGLRFVYRVRWLASSEIDVPFYANLEVRGIPIRLPDGELWQPRKNEPSEIIGFNILDWDDKLMAKWWANVQRGAGVDEQTFARKEHRLQRDVWYSTRIVLTATIIPNQWQVTLEVRAGGKRIWRFQTNAANSPNMFQAIGMLMFGIERENQTSGRMYIAVVEAYTESAAIA